MIVHYIKERHHKGKGQDSSLTLGNTYIVFGIICPTFDRGEGNYIITRDSDGTPILVEMKFFEIVDPRIPDGWEFHTFSENFCIEPKEFNDEFWNLYHDGDEKAETVFVQVEKKLRSFHCLDKEQLALKETLQRELIENWDPLGIKELPEAADEYNQYVERLFDLLSSNVLEEEIFNYLWKIEREHMGLCGNRKATERFASKLKKLISDSNKN